MVDQCYTYGCMSKIEECIWLGDIRAAEDGKMLLRHGFTHMLSIGYFPKSCPPEIKQLKITIMDSPGANIKPHLDQAADFIKEAVDSNGKILVHCYAGISRSSSCVIAYLIREKELGYFNALYFCRQKRNIVCPNMGFS